MTRTIRSIASKACQKAALCTGCLFYSAFGISNRDKGHVPLLGIPSSTDSPFHSDEEDFISLEDRAHVLRPKQDKLYEKECEERCKYISSLRFMHNGGHHMVRIHPPASSIVTPQFATFHDVSDTSTPMHEQQIGLVTGQLKAKEAEKREPDEMAVSTYPQRRGAIKRKLSLLLPEPLHGEFGWAWYECAAVGKNGARYRLEHLRVHFSAL